MAKESIQIDGQKNMNSKMAHEGQRDGWNQETYERKNLDTNNNYDYSRKNLNFAIRDGKIIGLDEEERLGDAYKRRMAEIGAKQFKEGADNAPYSMATIILGGDRDVMRRMAFGSQEVDFDVSKNPDNSHIVRQKDIEQWSMDCYNWLCKRFGAKNVLGFEVHLDESNPHIHAWCMTTAMKKAKGRASKNKPRKEKEQLSFKTYFGEIDKRARKGELKRSEAFRMWHDDYFNEIGSRYGLERGDDMRTLSEEEKADRQHKSKADFVKAQELKQQIKGLEEDKRKADEAAQKAKLEQQRQEKRLSDLKKQEDGALKRIDLFEQQAKEAQNKAQRATNEVERVNIRLNTLKSQEKPLQQQIEHLTKTAALTDKERKATTILGKIWEYIISAIEAIISWQTSNDRPQKEQVAIAQGMAVMVRNGIAKNMHDAGEQLWEKSHSIQTNHLYGGVWDEDAHRDVMKIASGLDAQIGKERGLKR